MKKFKEIMFKKVLPIAFSVIVPVSAFSACSKKPNEPGTETTSIESTTSVEPTVKEITVYVYKKPTFVSYVAVDAQIGGKIKLAQNDEIANDAYSALNDRFDVVLNDKTFVKPGDEVTVSAIAYVDDAGEVKMSYKKGTKVEDLPVKYDESGKEQVSYQISNSNGVIGYVSYIGNERKLCQDMLIETSYKDEVPEDFKLSGSYTEISKDGEGKHFNDDYEKSEMYILK